MDVRAFSTPSMMMVLAASTLLPGLSVITIHVLWHEVAAIGKSKHSGAHAQRGLNEGFPFEGVSH